MRSRLAAMFVPMPRLRARPTESAAHVLAVLSLMGALAAPARAQDKLWMTQLGTSAQDVALALAPDGAGGVMVAGNTLGSLGGVNVGRTDVFIARYDASGAQLWTRQFGMSGDDQVHALAPDGAGGVMVAGQTDGSLGGPNAGGNDAFVTRYSATGNWLWSRLLGTNSGDIARALAPDGAGGVMVAGETNGDLGGPNAGGSDAFVARYDASGTWLWSRQLGANSTDAAQAIAPDGVGGVMIAGQTSGVLGGASAGGMDAFVARYDADGTLLWVRQFGTSSWDNAHALAPDGAGGVMVAGYSGNLLMGTYDAFVARYDADGNQLWFRKFGTGGADSAQALVPDGVGGVTVAGSTTGSLGGTNAGGSDAFVARYDASGTQLWVRQFGTNGDDTARALALDGAGGVMIAGETRGSLGGANAGSAGDFDAFVGRLVPCYADLDASTGAGTLDIFDFLAFQQAFIWNDLAACDCDTNSGWLVCDIFDFLCFQNAFVAGCP